MRVKVNFVLMEEERYKGQEAVPAGGSLLFETFLVRTTSLFVETNIFQH